MSVNVKYFYCINKRVRGVHHSIGLGYSHVVLKVNNSIFNINRIIDSINATMIITYFNLKL